MTGGAGGTYLSSPIDAQGCRKTEIFLDFALANLDLYRPIVNESTDGVNVYPIAIPGGERVDNDKWSMYAPTIAKYIVVAVRNLGSQVLEEGVLHCVSE